MRLQHMVEQQQAAAGGAVMAGAEGERGLDFDPELVGRNAGTIMLAVDQEASGGHGDEVVQAGLDPVLGFDRIEGKALRNRLAGDVTDALTEQPLIRLERKMQRDVPAAVGPFERDDRRIAVDKQVGELIDGGLGPLFVGNGETRAVSGGGEIHRPSKKNYSRPAHCLPVSAALLRVASKTVTASTATWSAAPPLQPRR